MSCLNRLSEEFETKNFLFMDCEPNRFTTLQCTSNFGWVLIYRLFVFGYSIAWLVADVVTNKNPHYLAYMTHWGEIIMVLYFFIALLIVVGEMLCQQQTTSRRASLRWYHVVSWIVFNVYATSAVIITVAYWIGILNLNIQDDNTETEILSALNIHVHGVNAVLVVIELLVGNMVVRILHFYWPMIFGSIYGLFTYVFYLLSGDIVYNVLDWGVDPVKAGLYLLGMLFFGTIIVHVMVVWLVFYLRQSISKKISSRRVNSVAAVGHNDMVLHHL